MPVSLDFSTAEEQRERLTQEQENQIKQLYKDMADEVGKQAEKAPRVPSDALRAQYLRELEDQMRQNLRNIQGDLNTTIRSNMKDVAVIITQDAKGFLDAYGLPIQGAYSHVPADIVQSVISGQLYSGDWTLSRALWLNTMETQKDVERVIAMGIAENKSAYDIAKDLERYVDPSARKDWEWSKVYPNTRKVVDYNAQRLARTMVSHAYQQAFVRVTQKNPFVTKYQWLASNSDRTCEICEERDGQLYDKDDLPLDHPNGMCTFMAVIEDSPEQIADRLADWAHGKDDPELESWGKDLYGSNWGQPPVPKEKEYKYHATTSRNIPGIIEKGLKPSSGHVGKGVYFANSTEDALWWTAETSTGGKTLLRVSLDYLTQLGYEEYTASESGYGVAEGLVNTKIPFNKIEIKVGDEWWSLSQYAEHYKNSVYRNLSTAAQKRVDKQFEQETEEWIKSRLNN